MSELPSGTVTFLFTDIEGSTRLLNELGASYADALAEHRRSLRDAFVRHGGVEVDTQGDAFFYVFATAAQGVAAAVDAQEALRDGPIKVRMGLHTGEPQLTDEGYVGLDVHKAARICAAGHGGQVLLSQASRQLLEVDVVDLGEHRLKDLAAAERIFQLGSDKFPPLKTPYRTNLPIPGTRFLGRKRELDAVVGLLGRDDVRLVTLTGAGGTGKTRLGLEAAASAAGSFPDGVFWVGLAALREPQLVLEQAGQAIGAKNELREEISDKHLLLVLDNFEHLVQAGAGLGDLLTSCPNLKLIVTSREPLHLSAEHEYAVPPLEEREALELFQERASAVATEVHVDDDVAAICRLLDFLPLAIELAAARVKSMSLHEIRSRLERHLPVLVSGPRDAPERQRTLRATIEWSYVLLTPAEQDAFARLAAFVGGAGLDAIDAVFGGEFETVASLVDKSLLRNRDDRYWMLETIREYAAERLDESPDAGATRARHARFFLKLASKAGARLEGPKSSEMIQILELEHPNIRVALRWGLDNGEPNEVLAAAAGIWRFWERRGFAVEGMAWFDEVLGAAPKSASGARLEALRGAVAMARLLGREPHAEVLAEEMLALAQRKGDVRMTGIALLVLGTVASSAGEFDRAVPLLEEGRERLRQAGDDLPLARAINALGYTALAMRDFANAAKHSGEALEHSARIGDAVGESLALANLGFGHLLSGREADAESLFIQCLTRSHEIGYEECIAYAYEGLAALAVRRGNATRSARLLGSADMLRETIGTQLDPVERTLHDEVVAQTEHILGSDNLRREWAAGRSATRDEAMAYALVRG